MHTRKIAKRNQTLIEHNNNQFSFFKAQRFETRILIKWNDKVT